MVTEALQQPHELPHFSEILAEIGRSPSIQRLASVSEVNSYHGGSGEENVLVHTQRVVRATGDYVTGRTPIFPESPDLQDKLVTFFESPLPDSPSVTRGELQIALALTHDIGKGVKDGVVTLPNGTTGSAGHEEKSVEEIGNVFHHLASNGVDLPGEVREDLATAIEHHGIAYTLLLSDTPNDTSTLQTEMDELLSQKDLNATFAVSLFVNVLSDFEAGRTDPEDKYNPADIGFSAIHKARAKELLTYYLEKI